jgi:methylenetetrahydrofolate dehydrogenase (NADP+)/methenyltetrahydrofolate cyclohydrolase
MTTILDGKALSERVRHRLAETVNALKAAGRRPPGLAVVLVGENPASEVCVRSKERRPSRSGCAPSITRFR